VNGDFDGLGALEANLRRMASVPARASKLAAENVREVITGEYATGSNPYGAPWAPLKPSTLAKGRHAPPLTDTGALDAGTNVQPLPGAGISVTFDAPYASFHHTGTSRMAARPVAPTGAFPRSWEKAITNALDETFAKTSEGK
jgi:hypothetical protein